MSSSARASSPGDAATRQSQRLRGKIELVLPALLGAGRRFVDDSRVAELYPEYVFMLHCVVRASVPLMETAREQAGQRAQADPVCAALGPYLEEHIPEERDHDEWLLDDLEALGRDRAAVLTRPPSPTIAAVVGAQYYWVLHYHPVALLGYIALLEGYPPSVEVIDELVERTGHSRAAFKTLIAHAELDPGHRDELDAALDGLPVTEEQSTVMGLSAMYSVQMLARAIDELRDGFDGAR